MADGKSGNDTLNGNGGNDTLHGAAGDDALSGGAGEDILLDSYGSNTLSGGDGNDRVDGIGIVNGDDGDDQVVGTGQLNGGGGNDVIRGSGQLAGGSGDDRYFLSDASLVIEAAGEGNDTIETSVDFALADDAHVETLTTRNSDGVVLTGNVFANTIVGSTRQRHDQRRGWRGHSRWWRRRRQPRGKRR